MQVIAYYDGYIESAVMIVFELYLKRKCGPVG